MGREIRAGGQESQGGLEQPVAEEHYKTLVEQLPAITYRVTLVEPRRTVYVSPQVESILGYTDEEWYADQELWSNLLHEDDRQRVLDIVEYSNESGRPFTLEYRIYDREGHIHWFRNQSNYIVGDDGNAHTVYGVMLDVTERRRVEEILQSTEDRFLHLFENSPDAIFVEDFEGRVLDANPVACRLHGMQHEELLGMNALDLVPRSIRSVVEDNFDKWASGEMTYCEGTSLRKSGEEVPVELRANRITYEGQPALLLHVRDITDRKRAEEELREARDGLELRVKERTAELQETNVRLQTEIRDRVKAEEREHNISQGLREVVNIADELLSCPDLDSVHKLAVEAARERLKLDRCAIFLCDGDHLRGTYGTDRNGETADEHDNVFPVETDWVQRLEALKKESKRILIVKGPYHEWKDGKLSSSDEGWAVITSLYSADELIGVFINDSSLSGAPVDPAKQEIVTVYCSVLGAIVGQKIAEESLRASQEQLIQSQKMEALGRLAGGVAHDFNNLLTAILGYSRLVLEESKLDEQTQGDIREVVVNAQRAAELTQKLLMFGRKQMVDVKAIDVNDAIGGMDQLLRHTLGEDVELITVLESEARQVCADRSSLEQVLLNLVINARDAMPEGGQLHVASSSVSFDEEFAKKHVGVHPGHYTTLSVRDTGYGMTEEVRSRVFEPFFTTKASGEGTGLGLSTVYGIVQQCKGYIEVKSRPGFGSEFKVYFPCAKVPGERLVSEEEAKDVKGTERILVVEDEDAVRRLTVRMLSKLGYRVMEAKNGVEGLSVCQETVDPIDLILSDVVMPQLGGSEMIKRAGRLRDDFRVLFMTGFTPDALFHRGVMAGDAPVLMKPFTQSALAAKVREVLDSPRMEFLNEPE